VRAELHRKVAGEILYRRDVLEGLVQTLFEKPSETVTLKGDETGYVENLRDLREGAALAKTSLDNTGIGSTGHQVIPPPVVGLSYITRQTISLGKRHAKVNALSRAFPFPDCGANAASPSPSGSDAERRRWGREHDAPGPIGKTLLARTT
jgi:hypothetical protein